ncbi:cation-efflux pump [Rhodobacter veldkampii DSM 11550]|uniref:Cation-efflux pump n=1 Tax=Phaeovulum veldkampii DSM 11550 TaxID=1185920 RepID=A0A2T4JGU7_9RHOB|nr:cation diffusion facilitator family transporter [Phaeovulum veldkampii]MBK5945231.1 cation-efflux pump [Phaeovulum veldkampii DSM 11550]PTE17007.1 cation-efflux pump [Phaeovulum veldkampii DSM 11550]TDQ56030.1 ferrous-iron efflux pump FieF [Phaeovulum veldkampii DSM 11550]
MGRKAAQHSLNLSAGLASTAVAMVLVALKLWAVGQTGSLSIAASATDSAMDLLISLGGLFAILYAARPADEDHHFGHTSVEDLTALGQSLFILAAAGAIGWMAGLRLMSNAPAPLAAETTGIVVMVVSAVLTGALVLWQRWVTARTGNRVVAADSLHYMGDLLPTLGAIMALAVSARFGVNKIDSIVALIAASIMVFGALKIGRAAWDALMDRAADQATVDGIAAITRGFPGVRGYHDLKTRTAGSRIFVHLHVELDGAQSLSAAHAISAGLKRAILEAYPDADIIIHQDVARD